MSETCEPSVKESISNQSKASRITLQVNPKGKLKTRIPRYVVDADSLKNNDTLKSQFNGVSRIVIQRRYYTESSNRVYGLKHRLSSRNSIKKLNKLDTDIVTIIAQYLSKLKLK